jgi:hypothetical protein
MQQARKKVEISQLVDQRRQKVLAFIKAHKEALARQGSVVKSFRRRAGRVVGPYYRLAFRDSRRQRSVYLGADAELAAEVHAMLQEIQGTREERRALRQLKRSIRKALSECKAQLRRELGHRGLWLKGYEVRGWRARRARAAVTVGAEEGRDG